MMKRPFAICLTFFALFLTALCSSCGQEAPEKAAEKPALPPEELGEYTQGIAAGDMRFLWRLQQDSIDIKLAGAYQRDGSASDSTRRCPRT